MPIISNLKKSAWASKRDVLELATLQYTHTAYEGDFRSLCTVTF